MLLEPSLLLLSPAFEITSLLLGLIVGSFANVCIHRLPRDYEPATGRAGWLLDLCRQISWVVHPPSHCPACGKRIRAYDNVPVLSWLVLRGRCRACQAPISARYPAVEAANGMLWLSLAVLHGPHLRTAAEALFVTALLILFLIDLEHQLLPDSITIPGTLVGLVASLAPGSRVNPIEAGAVAAGAYLAFAALAWIWKRVRGVDALGQGDWKMAAMLGAFLGAQEWLLTVFLASAAGSLVGVALVMRGGGNWQSKLPLGSFLALAGIVAVFVGQPLLRWYGSLLSG